jgi:hypothetical protein
MVEREYQNVLAWREVKVKVIPWHSGEVRHTMGARGIY